MEREEYIHMRNRLEADYCQYEKIISNVTDEDYLETQSIVRNMEYVRISGVESACNDVVYSRFVSSLYSLRIAFSFVLKVEKGKLLIYVGCDKNKCNVLKGLMSRLFSANIEESIDKETIFGQQYDNCGVIVGDVGRDREKEERENALDKLVKLRIEDNYAVVVVCSPLSNEMSNEYRGNWEFLATQLKQLTTRQTTIRDERESVSFTDTNNSLVRFETLVEKNIKKYHKAVEQGLFLCSIKYYADSESTCDIIAGTFRSDNCLEEFSRPFSRYNLGRSLAYDDRALITIREISIGDRVFKCPMYSNLFISDEVAYFVKFPSLDAVGFSRREIPDFEISREMEDGMYIGDVLRRNVSVGEYYLPLEDMNRHIFVPGMTGSGKTNTLTNILIRLNEMGIPWMCIEPAKAEYYSLYKYGVDDLKVIVAGSKGNPLFINPFEPINKEVSLQTHIDSLYSALLSSFTWVSPLPYVLENCLYRVYEECGFDLEDFDKNEEISRYPTIETLYSIIPLVVKEMGYEGKMEQDIVSSLQSRISTLRRGIKGDILNVANSMSMEELFMSPVVIELEEIGDNGVKSFIMSLLMVLLREYRMSQPDYQLEVKHFLLIEEAHRLLKNVASLGIEGGDPKANGVQYFTDMISELRAKGQGFIIADQMPEQLAPAVLRNTNLKICHRLVSGADSRIMGDCMHASEEQVKYMCNLKRGEAEVFSEGDSEPKLVKIPNAAKFIKRDRVNIERDEILEICRFESKKKKIKQYVSPAVRKYF